MAQVSHKVIILPYLIKHIPKSPHLNENAIVYAFDLDHTIIKPKSGSKFSRGVDDWMFMKYTERNPQLDTLELLTRLIENEPLAHIVIFSNQGAVTAVPSNSKSCTKYVGKVNAILSQIAKNDRSRVLLERLWVYASPKCPASFLKKRGVKPNRVNKVATVTKNDAMTTSIDVSTFSLMRKPNSGMYDEFQKDMKCGFDVKYYCGDAAGRAQDFSDSDKQYAAGLGIDFKTPEEVFGNAGINAAAV
ncbi:LAMI_0E02124g1_1 [Lachancea mirantina]|uniref:LAMI_0E02124g1_1 n=1 Tax=Lachancea mirantina TaxID=1230905 RepID=A0A1G4JJ62_9SACH|nr:LAMI_0E02124g1_1 [Lachancea mirantina]